MSKELIEKLKKAKVKSEIARINFFNDGSITEDANYVVERWGKPNSLEEYKEIEKILTGATESYGRRHDFDTIDMDLILGLVYDIKDVTEEKEIKEDAKPIKEFVRYYTGSVKSFLDGEQTNDLDYWAYAPGRQGYINYDQLVTLARKSRLNFNGPESFEEFKDQILSKEPFQIKVSADLSEEKEEKDSKRKSR